MSENFTFKCLLTFSTEVRETVTCRLSYTDYTVNCEQVINNSYCSIKYSFTDLLFCFLCNYMCHQDDEIHVIFIAMPSP